MRACVCVCVSTLLDVGLTSDQGHGFALPVQHHSIVEIGHSHSFFLKEGQLSVTGKTPFQALLYLLDGSI